MKTVKRENSYSPAEFYRRQLEEIINFKNRILTESDVTLMAYLKVHEYNYSSALLKDRIFTNASSIKNTVAKLTKLGFLVKDDGLKINPKIKLQEEDFVLISIYKVDTTQEEVYHKYYRK